jgi:hypothetical protein
MRRALLVILVLGSSAGAVRSQTSSPAFTPRGESPEEFTAGRGRDETFYACMACHNFKLVAQQSMSRERWNETLTFMTVRHNMPPLEGAERKVVLDYLEKNYPPRAPSRQGGGQNPFAPP